MKEKLKSRVRNQSDQIFLWLYALILISPSLMFYLTKSHPSPFIPVFLASQISMVFLVAHLLRKKSLFLLVFSPLIFAVCLQWGHYYLFKYEITEGALAAILSTNPTEATEFFLSLPSSLFLLFVLFLILQILLSRKIPARIQFSTRSLILFSVIIFLAFGMKLASSKSLKISVEQVVYKAHPLKTFFIFKSGADLLNDYKNKLQELELLTLDFNLIGNVQNQTHILVIGESARKRNWSLYGYPRKTNPSVEGLKDEVTVFADVISTANSTIPSLYNTLTYSRDQKIVTLFDIANQAGFSTYWISNQPQFGIYDNPTSVLAHRAQNQIFIRTTSSHDDLLLPELNKVLKNEAPKKLIVLHLMGSHGYYHLRYPENFRVFKECETPNSSLYLKQDCKVINDYDNSILFTDYLLGEIVTRLKQSEPISSLLYFSDHGENLLDNKHEIGHGGLVVSKAEAEIPFLIWLSDQFQQNRPELLGEIQAASQKELSLYDFFPSYLYLLGISTTLHEKKNFFKDEFHGPRFLFDPNQKKVFYKDLE